MFIRHHPAGASEAKLYEFRPEKVMSSKAGIAEKLYSKACGERRTWEMFVADAKQGSITARRIVLWLAISTDHPFAKITDMPDFEVGELSMEYSKQELRLMRQAIEESTEVLESEKQAMLAGLERQIEEADAGSDEPDPEPDSDVESGKAESDEPSTS